ncbi:fumarylacetoacetate hydrolase family protein [Halalkalicoccus jeotgali]|nr:fumarylacetoacetate hydrolase family protein [Halalkalicoccus jeotgali]
MKYVRFRDPAGAVRRGTWINNEEIRFGGESYKETDVDVLAPCEPSKIVCVGLNYLEHAKELGKEPPDRPRLFFKPPNTVADHNTRVMLPAGKKRLEYEAELAVVIGKQCRHVEENKVMEVVEGYTCMNDISNRDDQQIEQNYVRAKGFDGAAPLGPVVTTPDNVPDDAFVRTRVNGEQKQDGKLTDLIFSVPELVAEITTYMTLEAGDIVSTGTPKGVGPLADGDEVEVEIEGIGTLQHSVQIP